MNGSLGAYRAAASSLDNLSPQARALAQSLITAGLVQPHEIISGFRTERQNIRVGGADKSRHLVGDAIDIGSSSWPEARRAQVLAHAIAQGARGIGLYPGGSMHFDTRPTPMFWGPNRYKGMGVDRAPEWAKPHLSGLFAGGGKPSAPATTSAPTIRSGSAAPAAASGLLPGAAAAPEGQSLTERNALADLYILGTPETPQVDPMTANLQARAQQEKQAAVEQQARRKALFSGGGLGGLYG